MFATTSGTVDSFNNGKGSENTPTVVKPTLSGKVESSTTSAKRMNLKTRANISATEKMLLHFQKQETKHLSVA